MSAMLCSDIQARVTAAVSSGAGPDIMHMLHGWPHAMWSQDPVMLPFREAARTYRLFGYAGRPSAMLLA